MELTSPSGQEPIEVWRLGPTAYLPVHHLATWIIVFGVAYGVRYVAPQYAGLAAATAACLFALVQIYRVYWVRTVYLYMDASGVWLASGILPWRTGVRGVKWSDMKLATFNRTFVAWLTGCYTVALVERFTERADVRLSRVWHGDRAATRINQHLLQQQATSNPR